MQGVDEEKKMVMEIFQIHNDQMKDLVPDEFADSTHERYCDKMRLFVMNQ